MRDTDGQVHDAAARKSGLRTVSAPIANGVIVLIPSLIGLAAGQPWLFTSLRPNVFLLAVEPQQPTSKYHDTVAPNDISFKR